jgi:hypothetical protein
LLAERGVLRLRRVERNSDFRFTKCPNAIAAPE